MFRHWLEIFLGLWIMLSSWLLGMSSFAVMMWSNLIVGTAIVSLNLWEIFVIIPEKRSEEELKK